MSRDPNLVSVIIPCYNHGEFLGTSIDSILSQTYQEFEIIIVDDGSDDEETLKILKNIDTPKTTVYHKENGGVASARNFGIERSSGQVILTLDSDDMFAPTFIEKGLAIVKKDSAIGMVTSYARRTKGENSSDFQLTGGDVKDFLVKNHANASLMFRYQCWEEAGGYDEEIRGFEDWEFFINVTKRGWSVYSIPEYLFYYRDVEGSMYDRVIDYRPELIKHMVEKHEEVFKDHVTTVVYHKERYIKELNDKLNQLKNSKSMKIGNTVLKPFNLIKKAVFK